MYLITIIILDISIPVYWDMSTALLLIFSNILFAPSVLYYYHAKIKGKNHLIDDCRSYNYAAGITTYN